MRSRGLHPDDMRCAKDLAKIPILTKNDIRRNWHDLIASNVSVSTQIPSSSGGSTGKLFQFLTTRKAFYTCPIAADWRGASWGGYKLGDKMAMLWGNPADLPTGLKVAKRAIFFFARTMMLNSFHLDQQILERYAHKLERFNPIMIKGYSTAMYLFAKYMEREGTGCIRPRMIMTSAETLFDHQRDTIERVFGCDVFDGYGSRETCVPAYECEQHQGYHITMENGLYEFIKDGESCSDGESGEILITDFQNYAMPFIRYSVEDVGTPSSERCSCGRGLAMMKSIKGRTGDFIVRPNGDFVDPCSIYYCFDDHHVDGHIEQYQIIQESLMKIVIRLVKGPYYVTRDEEWIRDFIRKYVGKNIYVEIQMVDSIPPARSGKHRYVISKVSSRDVRRWPSTN
jgi:phenylacetate-CoA ligase